MVIDASVATKWFLSEERSAEARSLISDSAPLLAPSFLLFEVTHALWVAVRRGRAQATIIEGAGQRLPHMFERLADDRDLLIRSQQLMGIADHAIYDCLYLALAERDGATLITADERQYAAARRARIDARLL